MTTLGVATVEAELGEVLALGGRALSWSEAQQTPALLSASLSCEALVLGRLQREETLRQRSPASFESTVLRRATTGTEAQLSGAVLYHALALPRVDALYADASPRTLLNRNLRAILRGYTAAGVPLRYFGTEVLALLGQPVALVGYEQTASGAVLIEVLVGLEAPCVVRSALKREPAAALFAILRDRPAPRDLLQRAVRGVVERLGATTLDIENALPVAAAVPSIEPSDEIAAVAIPLGVVEATLSPQVRITGDLLASSHALSRIEALAETARAEKQPFTDALLEPLRGAALDGARPPDLLSALQQALNS
ncbi:MAG TPA: hypothetical protein VEQ58_04955 [Polyangiaceae bacterium]|nr:hypothetical protein [Polyangiaceae bacterium]